MIYELKTADGRVIRWQGATPEDAAARAADCLGVGIVAWRAAQPGLVVPVDISSIEG